MRPLLYGAILIAAILFLPKGLESLVIRVDGLDRGRASARRRWPGCRRRIEASGVLLTVARRHASRITAAISLRVSFSMAGRSRRQRCKPLAGFSAPRSSSEPVAAELRPRLRGELRPFHPPARLVGGPVALLHAHMEERASARRAAPSSRQPSRRRRARRGPRRRSCGRCHALSPAATSARAVIGEARAEPRVDRLEVGAWRCATPGPPRACACRMIALRRRAIAVRTAAFSQRGRHSLQPAARSSCDASRSQPPR